MKSADLHAIWGAPDNSRVTSKQYSFRLPVHVAAKIEALCEMYPTRSRTQIVGDLLSAALQGVEESFPLVKGKDAGQDPDGDTYYEEVGLGSRFRRLASKHYVEIEKGLVTEKPAPLYPPVFYVFKSDLEEK